MTGRGSTALTSNTERIRSVSSPSSGWRDGDYGDLAAAMIEAASPYIPKLVEQARTKQHEADIAEAERLLAKHGHELHL
jgi:hypothetical protein